MPFVKTVIGKRRILKFVLGFFLFAAVIFPLAGFWVRREVERRMKVEIGGTYVPVPFAPSFYLRDSRFKWDEKVKLISGDLKVDFNPLSIFLGGLLEIQLTSSGPEIELLGEWAELQGVRRLRLDHVKAHLGLAAGGVREIYSLHAASPVFQFHIQKSEG